MSTYLFRRLLFLLLTVLITSLIVFAVTQWLPGDVCRIILGREAGESALQSCRQDLGLDIRCLCSICTGWVDSFPAIGVNPTAPKPQSFRWSCSAPATP